MAIERIPAAVPAVTRTRATPAASDRTGDSSAQMQSAEGLIEIDQVTQQPVPPRFPWLSRLSNELQAASGTPSPFDPAPIVGETIDRIA
jgi:hypothetical protein